MLLLKCQDSPSARDQVLIIIASGDPRAQRTCYPFRSRQFAIRRSRLTPVPHAISNLCSLDFSQLAEQAQIWRATAQYFPGENCDRHLLF